MCQTGLVPPLFESMLPGDCENLLLPIIPKVAQCQNRRNYEVCKGHLTKLLHKECPKSQLQDTLYIS